jgi:hypothetical protein
MTLQPSDVAWIGLGLGVIAWDLLCPDGEMLSEASRRYAKNHQLVAFGVVASVGAHLLDLIPRWADPIHWVGVGLRRIRRLA